MPAAFPYLAITDGTTTCTILDGAGGTTNYALLNNTWAPAIASLRASALGGRGPYEDVVEELDLTIVGATAAAALTNLATLNRLLDQAERWTRGETGAAPVVIKYTVQGSAPAMRLQALILGRPQGGGAVELSPRFNKVGLLTEISGVRVRFRRRGQWLFERWLQENLIPNASIEAGTTGYAIQGAGVTITTSTTALFGGSSLQVTTPGTTGGEGVSNITPYITISPSTSYTASVYVRGSGTVALALQEYTSTPTFVAETASASVVLSATWQRLTITRAMTASGTRARLVARTVGAQAVTFLTDGWMLETGSTASEWHLSGADETTATTSAAADNPVVQTCAFGSVATAAPVSVALTGFGQVSTPAISPGFLIMSESANNIRVVDWPSGSATTTGLFSSLTDTTNKALGGTVQHYLPGSSTTRLSAGTGTLPAVMTGDVVVFAMVRNFYQFLLSVQLKGNGITTETQSGVIKRVGVAGPQPYPICLGTLSNELGHKSFEVFVQMVDSVTPGDTAFLDIDCLVFVQLTPSTQVLRYDSVDAAGALNASATARLEVQSRAVSGRLPFVGAVNTALATDVAAASYHGDPAWNLTGSTLACLWLTTTGAYWRHVATGASNATTQPTLTATRLPAYVTPQ